MGKINKFVSGKINFDPLQKIVIEEFKKDNFLQENFYFTGGTALSVFYLGHRLSEDLDFFSEKDFPPERILQFMQRLAKKHNFTYTLRQPEGESMLVFSMNVAGKGQLRVDFNHYPFKRIEAGKNIEGLEVDSLRDIGSNKLLIVNQRADIKDFVDLYFLFREFTVWDLTHSVEKKFGMRLEPVMLASDFLKVEEFDFLPKMLVPLELSELKLFFKEKAVEIGKRVTE